MIYGEEKQDMEVDSATMTSLDAPRNIGHTTELACSDVLDLVGDIVKMSAVLQPGTRH